MPQEYCVFADKTGLQARFSAVFARLGRRFSGDFAGTLPLAMRPVPPYGAYLGSSGISGRLRK
jgi:hypothetical protein